MIPLQNVKTVLPIFQASTTNAATASGNIDRLGYDYVTIDVLLPTSDNATNNPSVLKVSECDTTVVTSFSDVSGLIGDTDFTIPACATVASNITGPFATFNIDCRARKRYLKVSVSPLTTQVISVVGKLSRAAELPVGTTEQNSSVIVSV